VKMTSELLANCYRFLRLITCSVIVTLVLKRQFFKHKYLLFYYHCSITVVSVPFCISQDRDMVATLVVKYEAYTAYFVVKLTCC